MVKSPREKTLGKATGDVLKAIHALQDREEEGGVALPSDIADRTGTSRAFVTKMLKGMSESGLVAYQPYRGVRLTATGTSSAVELARHHRLLERFLTDVLGFGPDGAHDEAERLEHVISEEFEERLAAFLGNPTTCPHGAPIPNADGTMPDLATVASSGGEEPPT
ncbi:MAG TPA: metal-dependent transcriptional regulator [Armatimonadaceae bacterium]|nr:metal-dependent transcriptional regulator [Armatimonadaceae bacterium]